MSTYTPPLPRTRKMTIVVQDPSVRVANRAGHKILTAQVDVPAEVLAPGPMGYRVHVIDFDASTNRHFKPGNVSPDGDPFKNIDDARILSNPDFHSHNAYAIVMRTLARFELALGRRVSWGFTGHQIKVAPHAFADANAFYSEEDQALMFGYFPGSKGTVFSCLSHDVVAHETTHALVDGLRGRYTDPSSPDQAAFHEGISDVVALLSVYSLPAVVEVLIDSPRGLGAKGGANRFISPKSITPDYLRRSALFGLADEMGQELSGVRGNALRRSAEMVPSVKYINSIEYLEPHRRGEILVAAMMNAFLEVWCDRLQALGKVSRHGLDRRRVVEEGANAADYLLTMSIRALDYAPAVDLLFSDFLSALLTADREIRPDDSKYHFREILRKSFESYGIDPASSGEAGEPGIWKSPEETLSYARTHFEAMQRDPDEVFRFIWENRSILGLHEEAYSRVMSVRPCVRVGPDGFTLRETVAEYIQTIKLQVKELKSLGLKAPEGIAGETELTLYGGGALIFDEYGRLKFHVRNRILDVKRQQERLDYLAQYGYLERGSSLYQRISRMHRQRALSSFSEPPEKGKYAKQT